MIESMDKLRIMDVLRTAVPSRVSTRDSPRDEVGPRGMTVRRSASHEAA